MKRIPTNSLCTDKASWMLRSNSGGTLFYACDECYCHCVANILLGDWMRDMDDEYWERIEQ